MQIFAEIESVIDRMPGSWSSGISGKLKSEKALKLIASIVEKSHKEINEALLVFVAAIRYVTKDYEKFENLLKYGNFEKFLDDNFDTLLDIGIKRHVQANYPDRSLPILEVLGKMKVPDPIAVIELGASYGLIGYGLLNWEKMLADGDHYFLGDRKKPSTPKGAQYYLGIELDPPETSWLFACASVLKDRKMVERFIADMDVRENFELLKGSAFGFSEIAKVKGLVKRGYSIVILTSFMFYQYSGEKQDVLKNEIETFRTEVGGHSINQTVDICPGKNMDRYFIEWNGKRIIELKDDRSTDWKWI